MKTTVTILFAAFIIYCAVAATEDEEDFGSDEIDEKWSWNGIEEDVINDDSEARLSGGKNASITKYPFMASVLINGTLRGGATILNRKWLIAGAFTASFATHASEMTIRVGSASSYSGGSLCQVKKIVLHPHRRGYDNDVALIQLVRPLSFKSKKIRPIRIGDKPPKTDAKVLFTSFGENDDNSNHEDSLQSNGVGVLKETHFKFLQYKDCAPYYFNVLSFTKRCFCVKDSNSTSPEAKDFGSPIVYGKKLIGQFSGKPCGKNTPAVFVDTTTLKSWISRTMKMNKDSDLEQSV